MSSQLPFLLLCSQRIHSSGQ